MATQARVWEDGAPRLLAPLSCWRGNSRRRTAARAVVAHLRPPVVITEPQRWTELLPQPQLHGHRTHRRNVWRNRRRTGAYAANPQRDGVSARALVDRLQQLLALRQRYERGCAGSQLRHHRQALTATLARGRTRWGARQLDKAARTNL